MAIQGGFFEAKIVDGVYDREYSAAQYAAREARMVSDGISVEESTVLTTQNEVSKVPATMNTEVAVGAGFTIGYEYTVDAPLQVTHVAADPLNPRIDRICIECNFEEDIRAFRLVTVTGTPAASPAAPAITRDADKYQISLAQILIPANVASLDTAILTDERGNDAVCGIANIKLGIKAPTGDDALSVVVVDTAFNRIVGTDQQTVDNSIDSLIDAIKFATNTGTANSILVAKTGFKLQNGDYVEWEQTADNTANPTINVNGLGVKSLRDSEGALIAAGDLKAGFQKAAYQASSGFFLLPPKGGGKKFAEGSAFVGSDYLLAVSGLSFTPTIVITYQPGKDYRNISVKDLTNQADGSNSTFVSSGGGYNRASSMVWTADGFTLWPGDRNQTTYWIAIE